jgi:predicted ATPase
MAYEVENFDFDKHIDTLIDIATSVNQNDITILTGANGYGKSFLRKIMGMLHTKHDFPKVASVSMEMRTNAREDYSALKSMMMDNADESTSNHTCYMIESLLKTEDRYFVIDEPEIGMGKEMLLGLIEELNEKISLMKAEGKFKGIMFITHSDFFIDHINYDRFINLEGMNYDQWKNREIKPINPKKLSEWSLAMWRAIEKRLGK